MIGLILCGGQSSRMGSDKGLLKLESRSWAQLSVDKLSALGIPVCISINNKQLDDYRPLFPHEALIVDDESLDIHGPLAAVLTAHLKFPATPIFVLACDMPLMTHDILKRLLLTSKANDNYDAFVYSNDGEPEPLCGIYQAKGLEAVRAMHLSGNLLKHSMKFMLYHIHTLFLALEDDQKKAFRNFNAHAELNGL